MSRETRNGIGSIGLSRWIIGVVLATRIDRLDNVLSVWSVVGFYNCRSTVCVVGEDGRWVSEDVQVGSFSDCGVLENN